MSKQLKLPFADENNRQIRVEKLKKQLEDLLQSYAASYPYTAEFILDTTGHISFFTEGRILRSDVGWSPTLSEFELPVIVTYASGTSSNEGE